jgi:peptide/nickel transport system substrate-binding protein
MRNIPATALLGAAIAVSAALGACRPSDGQLSGPVEAGRLAPPKTLVVGDVGEPPSFGVLREGASAKDFRGVSKIPHNSLVFQGGDEAYYPQVATALPSLQDGTWVVNPDGTMDITWKLRPNVRWHDGTPFTSDDLLFSFTVYKDPQLTYPVSSVMALIDSASTQDPTTFVVHWKTSFAGAATTDAMTPILPRHLLEDLFRNDQDAFPNSPYFTSGFVGLGPYRLDRWEQGQFMEFSAFEAYYQGRPAMDRLIVRFVFDPSTLVATILAGDVDVVLTRSLDIDAGQDIGQRWEGTGNTVRFDPTTKERYLEIQHRQELARPKFGLTELPVRQAFYQAMDRSTLAEVVTGGRSPIADSWIGPNSWLRPQVEAYVPQFPYDLRRAQELLTESGWQRGSDGVLVHRQTGERFEVQLRTQVPTQEKVITAIGDGWRAIGAVSQIDRIPAARLNDREYLGSGSGAIETGGDTEGIVAERLASQNVASPANRWTGRNRSGYANPAADPILDRLQTTLDIPERIRLHQELMRTVMPDVPFMFLYWEVLPVFMLKGVEPSTVTANGFDTVYQWKKD